MLYIDGDHIGRLRQRYRQLVRQTHGWWDMLFHDCFFSCEVQDAVLDFTSKHDTTIVRTPYVGAEYWLNPTGSVAHLIKR